MRRSRAPASSRPERVFSAAVRSVLIWAPRILLALLLAVVAWHLALRLRLVTDPRVDLGGAEINTVYGAQKLLLGRPLYEDPEMPPFDVMQYAPAHYAMLDGLARSMGVGPEDSCGLFKISRCLALLLNLLTCAVVFALCRAIGCPAWPSMAAAALTFTLYTEHFYGRGDALYALLFTGALLAYTRWMLSGDARVLLLAALLSVCCVSAKQTGALVIGIVLLDLLMSRAWRGARLFAAALVVLLGTGWLLLVSTGSATFFFKNTVQGLANGISPSMHRELFDLVTYKYYAPFHLAAVFLLVRAFRSGDRLDRFLGAAMVLSLAFGLLTGLKSGSNLNYLFEAHMLAAIAAARRLAGIGGWRAVVVLLFVLAFSTYRTRLLQLRVGTEEERERHATALHADLAVHDRLIREFGLKPEDWVLITYRGHLELLLNGQGLLAQKDVIAWSVEEVYDRSVFLGMMDGGDVRCVISDAPLDTLRLFGHAWALDPLLEEEGRYVLGIAQAGR